MSWWATFLAKRTLRKLGVCPKHFQKLQEDRWREQDEAYQKYWRVDAQEARIRRRQRVLDGGYDAAQSLSDLADRVTELEAQLKRLSADVGADGRREVSGS